MGTHLSLSNPREMQQGKPQLLHLVFRVLLHCFSLISETQFNCPSTYTLSTQFLGLRWQILFLGDVNLGSWSTWGSLIYYEKKYMEDLQSVMCPKQLSSPLCNSWATSWWYACSVKTHSLCCPLLYFNRIVKEIFARETRYFCVIYYVIRGVELRPMSQWLHHLELQWLSYAFCYKEGVHVRGQDQLGWWCFQKHCCLGKQICSACCLLPRGLLSLSRLKGAHYSHLINTFCFCF